jgi:hypothetical protein
VGTVDSFQGLERHIIAITLTRSNPQGEIGFLSDIRRMNVGMTRVRRKLLLVGDSSTLCRHPFFGELLADVKGVGGRTARVMVELNPSWPLRRSLKLKSGPAHAGLPNELSAQCRQEVWF